MKSALEQARTVRHRKRRLLFALNPHALEKFPPFRLLGKNNALALESDINFRRVTKDIGDADKRCGIPDTPPEIAILVFVLSNVEKLDFACILPRVLRLDLRIWRRSSGLGVGDRAACPLFRPCHSKGACLLHHSLLEISDWRHRLRA